MPACGWGMNRNNSDGCFCEIGKCGMHRKGGFGFVRRGIGIIPSKMPPKREIVASGVSTQGGAIVRANQSPTCPLSNKPTKLLNEREF
ncbi:hypothetical protein CK203_026475 [Vitis vinifera]|uniref:Uncharacterized protein n=1 Tax=Vitis vinifera TaxID=29760 RepID=A0A438IVH7_VITVI|nr:hypothetical protein CK203_026475 [Vitis vinifera]